MLGHYVCRECETVYAAPEPPDRCSDCGGRRLAAIAPEGGAAAYFAGVLREE